MKISANGIEMRYELSGTGPCLVLIHGFTDNADLWYRQVPAFAQHYQVLTYDVRGFGETGMGDGYSFPVLSEDLLALLQSLHIPKASLLGFSMGGRIALEFAATHPDMTAGLILANSSLGGHPNPEMQARLDRIAVAMQKGDNAEIAEMMVALSVSEGFKEKDPEAYQRFKELKLRNDPAPYLKIMQALFSDFDGTDKLGLVACPTLIIAGQEDPLMERSEAAAITSGIADATLETLPTGHAAAIEMPEEFNRTVLDFLKRIF
ncbi:alpha/beta fold hydrolase [candidate division KSB3 bacterium]|nr:alpha/beta fold hydrolase [candidate division KSB3 bacterium]